MAIEIITENLIGFPGETVKVDVDGVCRSGDAMILQLVDEIGLCVTDVPIVNKSASLTLPSTTELGEYSLNISHGDFTLDSVPFEIVKESAALLIRQFLLASRRQAEAFDALQKSDFNRAVKAAIESVQLNRTVDQPELANELHTAFVNALASRANESHRMALKVKEAIKLFTKAVTHSPVEESATSRRMVHFASRHNPRRPIKRFTEAVAKAVTTSLIKTPSKPSNVVNVRFAKEVAYPLSRVPINRFAHTVAELFDKAVAKRSAKSG